MVHSGERVGRYFDQHAPDYDEGARRRGWPGTSMLAAVLREWPRSVDSALDLGTGTGAALGAIIDEKDPQRIVAVDTSQGMLDRLREKYPDPRICMARCAIGEYLAATQETFDLMTAMLVMHFIPNFRDTIESMAPRLNQGARLIFTYDPIIAEHPVQSWPEWPVPGEGFSVYRQHPDEIIDVVQDSGLTVISERQFRPKPAEDPGYKAGFIVAEKQQQ